MFELQEHPDCPTYKTIPCSECRQNAVVIASSLHRGWEESRFDCLYGEAICLYCPPYEDRPYSFGFNYNQKNGEVTANDAKGDNCHYKHFPVVPQTPVTSKVFIATKGVDDDFRVCGVFTRSAVQNTMIDFQFQEAPVPKQQGTRFMVFVIVKENRVDSVYTDKAIASDMARIVGGRVHAFRAVPAEPVWFNEVTYLFYVHLTEQACDRFGKVRFMDRRSRNVKQLPGDVRCYTITRRRPYRTEIPYRLEISGFDKYLTESLAHWVADNLTIEEIETTFEYNVDFLYRYNEESNEWEREPCQEIIHDEETVA